MKKHILSIIIHSLVLLSPVYSENWELVGPNGTRIWCMELIDETDQILIGTNYRGIYKCDINGGSWSSVHQGLVDTIANIQVIDFQPVGDTGQYLMGVYSGKTFSIANLYVSQDNCNSWQPIAIPVTCSGTHAFWIDPQDNEHWIWSGFVAGFHHTFNSGLDWEIINFDDNPGAIKFLTLPGSNNIVFNISEVGPRPNPNMGGIERSTDSGLNWVSVWNGPPDSSYIFISPSDITSNPFNSQHLIVVNQIDPETFSDYRWMESFNGGVDWQPRIINLPSLYPYRIAYDPIQQGVIYVGTVDRGLFKSENNGETWVNVTSSITRGDPITAIEVDLESRVYVAFFNLGLYRSDDGGNCWTLLTETLDGGSNSFFFDKIEIDELIYSGNGRLLQNNGNTFNRIDANIPLEAGLWVNGVFDPINSGRIYAGLAYQNQGLPNLWFTDNEGLNWFPIENQPATINNIEYLNKVFSGDSRLIMIVNYGSLWTYDTSLDIWQDVTPPGSGQFYNDGPVMSDLIPGLWYCVGFDVAYRTENYGEEWTELNIPAGIFSFSIFTDPVYPDMVWGSGLDVYPLLKSLNRGDTWETVESLHFYSSQKVWSICRFMNNTDVILIGLMHPYSTFISYDNGNSWESFTQGLNYQTTFNKMMCYPEDSSTIWAATSDGIKYLTWVGNSIDENGWQSPSDIRISAYPNPFNPETNISFSLPLSGEAVLSIYDIQGREVARLIDGFQSAGSHTIVWNAEHQPSGVYFARLFADGGQTQTRKLVLMK